MFVSFQTVYSRKFQITVEKICLKLWLAVWHSYDQAQALSRDWKKNVPYSTNVQDKLPFVNSTKRLIFDLTRILLPKCLVLTYSLIANVIHYQIIFSELKSSHWFLSYVQFYLSSHFPRWALAAHLSEKWITLNMLQTTNIWVNYLVRVKGVRISETRHDRSNPITWKVQFLLTCLLF